MKPKFNIAEGATGAAPATTTATGGSAAAIKMGALPVVCWTQRDNQVQPHRTCNSSSHAMFAKFLGANIESDDQYWRIVNKYGDSTDHAAQSAALNEIGITGSVWRTDLTFADIDAQLDRKKPVPIGILHRGPESAPTGGHVLIVIGRTPNGDYIVNDPYGSVNDDYQDATKGCGEVYTRAMLNNRWRPGGSGGHGRII